MKTVNATLLFLLIITGLTLNAQEKFSKIVLYPASLQQLGEITQLLDIDHYYQAEGGIVAEVSSGLLSNLGRQHVKYRVLVDDVYRQVRAENARYFAASPAARVAMEQTNTTVGALIKTPNAFKVQSTFGGYYSFNDMDTAMTNLQARYPAIVKKISLGTSIEGRAIWCIKISDNVNTDEMAEPDLLYIGLQHAREAIGGASMIFLMQYLAENYATDPQIQNLVNTREFYIVPCMNPDGWEFNRTTATGTVNQIGGGQRKNRRNVGTDTKGTGTTYYASSQKGVDLNRNWSVDWGNCAAPILGPSSSCGTSGTNPSSPTYYGTAAFSEPETQAIRNLVKSAGKNFVLGFDQHSYGPYYSLPYGRRSLHGSIPATDSVILYNTSALMGRYNGMRANDSYGALGYEVAGGFKDWMLMGEIGVGAKIKAYGITGEGAAGGGTSGSNGSFWAPAAQIINLCKGMVYQDLQLAYVAGSYVDIQDMSGMNLGSKTGSVDFKIRRIGLQDKPVTVSLVPLQNMSSCGAPVVVSSLPAFNDEYSGSIAYTLPAALSNGQIVKFAWKVQTDGFTYMDTVTKFFNGTSLLSDNMEGSFAASWTNGGTNTMNWGYTVAGTGFGGTGKALSESPAANAKYTSNTVAVVQNSGTYNLVGATAAYLSFWIKHRTENFRDKMRVEVSTNGTSWTAISGSTTIQEPGTLDGSTINGLPSFTGIRNEWTRELFDLSAYNSASALRIRFNFTSDGDGTSFVGATDDGIQIDNLELIKTNALLITLPVSYLDFSAKLLAGNTGMIHWAVSDATNNAYYILEKSRDGSEFHELSRFPDAGSVYNYKDEQLFNGNNFYRLKQVDLDGKFSYSNTINLFYSQLSFSVQTYPNPVQDELRIWINPGTYKKLSIALYDSYGRVLNSAQLPAQSSAFEYHLNMSGRAAQLYVLAVYDENQRLLSKSTFYKN